MDYPTKVDRERINHLFDALVEAIYPDAKQWDLIEIVFTPEKAEQKDGSGVVVGDKTISTLLTIRVNVVS